VNNRRVNIMPMAGEGLRFINAGYRKPKPLINIDGKPMFIRSAKCMPKADLWIFISQKKFLTDNLIAKEIEKNFKNYNIIGIDQTTEGQASTCSLARKYLKNDDQIFINACDSFIEFDFKKYYAELEKYDVLVFTTKRNQIHLENPKAYGWVKVNKRGILNVSCKKPFNKEPSNERPIVGTFFFSKLKFFINSIDSLFKKKNKINNEYYLDMAIAESVKLGFKVGEFLVDDYVDFGRPGINIYEELEKWKNNKLAD